MEKGIDVDFLDYFTDLSDPRSQRNRLYSLAEILLVTLCAAKSAYKAQCIFQHVPFLVGVMSYFMPTA
jgi:hypothetical protein